MHSDIISGIFSGILFGIYFAFYLASFLGPMFWHFICYAFWRSILSSAYFVILSGILSGVYSCILSWIFLPCVLALYLASGMYSDIVFNILSGIQSGIHFGTSREKEVRAKEWGIAFLFKSRGPHLTGGEIFYFRFMKREVPMNRSFRYQAQEEVLRILPLRREAGCLWMAEQIERIWQPSIWLIR